MYAERRKDWVAKALFGLLAGLTRASVFPLAAALLWMAWEEGKPLPVSRRTFAYFAAVAPLFRNVLFILWRAAQGFPSLSQTMQQYWMQSIAPPWKIVSEIIRLLRADGLPLDF